MKTGEEADTLRKTDLIQKDLRLAGCRAERDEVFRMQRSRQLPDEIALKLIREIDLLEARFV